MHSHHSRNGFLTDRGYAEVAQRSSREGLLPRGGVDTQCGLGYLDKVGSVSGLELERDLYRYTSDTFLDDQYRRVHNGS